VHILGYSFCAEQPILTYFCGMLLPLKHQKIFAQKLPCFGAKNVGEIDPGVATSLKYWCSGSLS
jgi:hypothetical protein